jgi:hypothetical protein
MDLLKSLHLTGYEELDLNGKTFAQVTAELNGFNTDSLREEIMAKFRLEENDSGLQTIEWLGVLDQKPVHLDKGSAFDLTSDLMIEKMMMKDDERDMVIMQGKIKDAGVHIPIKKTIYKPVLAELAGLGISMTESIEQAPSD